MFFAFCAIASVSVAQPRYRCEWLRDSPGGGSSLIRCRRQRIGARGNGRGSYYDGTIISPYLQCSNWEQSFITINLFKNMYGDYMWTTGQRQVKICQMNQEREELYNIILYQGKHQSGLTTAGRHTSHLHSFFQRDNFSFLSLGRLRYYLPLLYSGCTG